MEINELNTIRKNALQRVKAEFDNENIAAVIREPDEYVLFDELAVLLPAMGMETDREVMGEFSFLPTNPDDTLQTFLCVYNLTDELPQDHLGELIAAVAQLNYYLPYGAFGLSAADGKMVYKLSTPLPLDLSEEGLYDQMEILISCGFNVTDQFIDILMGIAEGTNTIEDLADYIGLEEDE